VRFPGPTHLVVGFQHRAEAERFLKEFRERLAKFGLEMHPEKTRLIEFGRQAWAKRQQEGKGKPETFQFLGFTHYLWGELERVFQGMAGDGEEADEGEAERSEAAAAHSDARADCADREMAEADGTRLLPIPCGAGQSTQAGDLSRAVAEVVAAELASPRPDAKSNVGEAGPNLHEMDTCTPHPASLSQCAIRRPYPR
jgi:hypothetical protein